MKKKINRDEKLLLTVLKALLEAKQVIEIQNSGSCLVSINKSINLVVKAINLLDTKPAKRKNTRK